MPLARQVVPVLLKGLDQLAPRQTGIMSGLDALLNMYAQQGNEGGYEFVPRPGTTSIAAPTNISTAAGYKIATLNGQLLLLTSSGMWRRATDGWHTVAAPNATPGAFSLMSQRSTPVPVRGFIVSATSTDTAYVNGYTIRAITGATATPGQTAVVITATDANGDGSSDFAAVSATQVRIAVVGTVAVVFWAEPGTSTINALKFDTATAAFGAVPTVITAFAQTAGAYNPIFDIQAIPGSSKIAIIYNNTGGSTLSQVLLTPSTMTLGGVTTYGGKGTNFVTKGYLTNSFATNTLFIAYISSVTGLNVDQFDAATLANTASAVYDAAATAGASITGYRSGVGTAVVYYTLKGTLPYDDVIKTSSGAAASTLVVGRALASRSTDGTGVGQLSTPRFLTKYRGVGQCTYFLSDGIGREIGRAMPDVAAADPTNALAGLLSLPNLMTGATASTYLTAGLRSVAIDTGAAGITSSTGAAVVSFLVGDSSLGRPVEINGSLYIPGSLPLQFDGGMISEAGFPVAPEQSDAYVLAGGGTMTPSATYTYRYVLEWTDNNGQLHRSAPNLSPQQAVLGAAQTQVTHAIPFTNIISRKIILTMAIYRTPANGDGSVYYRAGSVDFGVQSSTVPARLAFVDQMSDATLVGQVPLYTDGGILENLAPPPCTTMAAHRGRLLVGGVDLDPTAVWFSKDVSTGFGVAFNDGLVSRLGGSNETVTALGSMDSFVAAFTNTTAWASSDEYPDDTGAPGVLRFIQNSAMNGCAGPRLIARGDDGLMCWQAKTAFTDGPGPGPWRYSRGSSWEWVGQGAQLDAAVLSPKAFLAVPGLNQIRVIGGTASALVRELTFGTWATWTYLQAAPTIVDATVWNGAVVYLCADGSCLLESTTIYSDSNVAIAHSITMSPFNFAGVAGYQRIYVGQLTGRILGTAAIGESLVLAVTQTIDGTAMAAKNRTLTPDANSLFAGVEFDPGPNGKCSAYQLTIANAAGGANDSRCAWALAAITMEVGIKPNVNRLPPAQRAT